MEENVMINLIENFKGDQGRKLGLNNYQKTRCFMKKYVLCAFISGIVLFSNCAGPTVEEEASEHEVLPENIVEINSDQYKMAGIELGFIEQKSMSNLIKAAGIITVPPQNFATVCASFGGYIKSTSLLQGSPVKKGQVLAIIENPEFIEIQQGYLENKSQLEFLEGEIDRQKTLYNENISSAKLYQQTLSDYKSMKSRVRALEQKLALIGIDYNKLNEDKITASLPLYSPISGFVKAVNVNIGKYVAPTDVLFEIVNNAGLTLEIEVFEKDAGRIEIGQQIRFSVLSFPEKELTAKIYQSGKSLDRDQSVKVYAHINAGETLLMPGMAVNAFIQTEMATVSALPAEAIVSFDDKYYIFLSKGQRIENGKQINDFESVEIRKGITENGFTEVILPERLDIKSAKIVVKGAYQVLSAYKNAGEMAC